MEKYYIRLRDAVNSYADLVNGLPVRIAENRHALQTGVINRAEYEKKNAQIDMDLQRGGDRYRESVAAIHEEGRKAAHDKYGIRADMLTQDAAIFTTGIKLSNNEVQYYAKQYKGNPAMLRVIAQYAEQNDLDPVDIGTTEDEVVAKWDRVCKGAAERVMANNLEYADYINALVEAESI